MRCPTCGRIDRKSVGKSISKAMRKSKIRMGKKRVIDYEAVKLAYEAGWTVTQIAKSNGISLSSVSRIVNRGENKR